MTMMTSSAVATPPLPAGKPAGTKQAQLESNGVLLFAGIVAVAAAIAVVAATTESSTATTSTSG
jgi:hypothetical protein